MTRGLETPCEHDQAHGAPSPGRGARRRDRGRAGRRGRTRRRPARCTAAFDRAAAEFDVPRDLLVAVGYGETRLDGHGGQPSRPTGTG